MSQAEWDGFGRYAETPPDRGTLERFFFLDDADRELVEGHRGTHSRLGFGLQLVTVRHVGRFLPDPLDVPASVVDYLAVQLRIDDPSSVKRYLERRNTRYEHQAEIAAVYGYRDFAAAEGEFLRWLDDQAWTTGEGPKALFYAAVAWLRQRRVLLPGVSTLAEAVASVRNAAQQRLYAVLAQAVSAQQAVELEAILRVPEGRRRSQLDLWRHAERSTTGKGMSAALHRVTQIAGLGMRAVEVPAVPARRVIGLARYGMAAKAPKLAGHPYERKLATLLATVRWLEVQATDDALELFDVFMTNELIGRAGKNADRQKLRRLPGQSRHVAVLASAVQVLFEADGWGEAVPLDLVWEAIDTAVGSRARLAAAVAGVQEMIPPPAADVHGQWRAQVVERFATVRPFVRLLCEVIEFGATVDAASVLAAMRDLAHLLEARPSERVPKGYLDARKVNVDIVPKGWWQQLVFPSDRPAGTVDRNAYVFCVLELFHTALKHRDIYAVVSDRWADPRAKLLAGQRWQQVRGPALSALQLPDRPDELFDELTATVDAAWRAAAGGIVPDGPVTVDADGRLHLAKDDALDEPQSLVDLRARTSAMLPEVDLPEMILELMALYPAFPAAFTSISGSTSRLGDLHVSVAALLTAHALNVGLGPVIAGADALTRDRLAHVDQYYLRPNCYRGANAVFVDAQAELGLAQLFGGGLVAAVDGMRFVVPVRSVDARPNPKYFARKRGVTWLNMISDQAIGLTGRVLSGTPRDTLHFVDLVYDPHGGPRPEVLITDAGSYSDLIFGIVTLLGFDYRPVLADLPDTKLWRIDASADYGYLDRTARGRSDLGKIARHWPDILRVIASIHTREISAHDAIRVLQRDGRLNALGEAIAHYGRIFKTLHVLTLVEDPAYRREMKRMRNLQEQRHGLGRKVFHGRKGEVYRAYHDGMEDQLGALGLVLNCVTLWNTLYLDHAMDTLRTQGYPVRDADAARLSVYQHAHLNVHGHYSFVLPDLAGGRRPLRNPDQR
ncbi:Tn3 family transposase [Micromonospora fiedleri]|uniref:Tn3 family transposase n=2 Tax=Micromonospora TaxID=1873 RepID=A0ABS1UVB9_9ACTN|nr:Tn3 family transposase [Micromonospora fiedleri]GIJ18687.1 transposase [Micromonospora gifhornensis]